MARAELLQPASRNDVDGIEKADVEALSSPLWKQWKNSLSVEQTWELAIWRGGAVWTPTRRFSNSSSSACPWCPELCASARHFFANCPKFEDQRNSLSAEFDIPADWWRHQPRVTAKSGWITEIASASAGERARMQIPAALMGMAIITEMQPVVDCIRE